MNILIAEDNQFVQMMHSHLMNEWGFRFDIASNGQEAMEFAKNNKYDLCIMDIEMPIMNGIEATKLLRKTLDYLPILAFSSNKEYKNECLSIGVDDFAEKACLPMELLAKIISLTVKYTKITMGKSHFLITKETPVNPKQASVLKQLKEKNLSMISIFGNSTEATFIVNETIPDYIEREFAENNKQSVRFLDHNPEGQGMCRLFSRTSMVVKDYLLDDEFENYNREELRRLNQLLVSDDS